MEQVSEVSQENDYLGAGHCSLTVAVGTRIVGPGNRTRFYTGFCSLSGAVDRAGSCNAAGVFHGFGLGYPGISPLWVKCADIGHSRLCAAPVPGQAFHGLSGNTAGFFDFFYFDGGSDPVDIFCQRGAGDCGAVCFSSGGAPGLVADYLPGVFPVVGEKSADGKEYTLIGLLEDKYWLKE